MPITQAIIQYTLTSQPKPRSERANVEALNKLSEVPGFERLGKSYSENPRQHLDL
jgi:hypothetical protein